MWVVTTQGFYSAVEHRDDPDVMIVRARVRNDLRRLTQQLPGAGINRRIYRDLTADYPYRLDLSRDEWAEACRRLAAEVDYPNFKSAVGRRQGWDRERVYHKVWDALCGLEKGGPWKRWAKNRKPFVPRAFTPAEYDRKVPDLSSSRSLSFGFGDIEEDELTPEEAAAESVVTGKRGSRR